jgi:hypothetical protein
MTDNTPRPVVHSKRIDEEKPRDGAVKLFSTEKRGWGGRRDLNPRLSVPQTDALPAELLPPPSDSSSLRYFLALEKRREKAPGVRRLVKNFGENQAQSAHLLYEPEHLRRASNS